MKATCTLAGYFAAHGILTLSADRGISPMVAVEDVGGERRIIPFDNGPAEACVDAARAWIAQNPDLVPRAVLLYDGRIKLDSGECDALVLEALRLSEPPQMMTFVVPYRPVAHDDGFAVHRPKIAAVGGFEPDYEALTGAFFAGVEEHEHGADVWSANLDDEK